MKKIDKRNVVYLGFFLLSVLLIGLFFTNQNCLWCIVSCSVGASLFGAVVLGFCFDITSKLNIKKQNKRIFKVANINIYAEINNLLTIINRVIRTLYELLKLGAFEFEDLSIKELVKLYADAINKIKEHKAPLVANDGVTSQEEIEYMRLVGNATKYLNATNSEFKKSRKRFAELKKNFEVNKNILLVNNIATENHIYTISAILNELGRKELILFGEAELFDFGVLLGGFDNNEVIDTLNAIGFEDIKLNNKNGYLEIKLAKRKIK